MGLSTIQPFARLALATLALVVFTDTASGGSKMNPQESDGAASAELSPPADTESLESPAKPRRPAPPDVPIRPYPWDGEIKRADVPAEGPGVLCRYVNAQHNSRLPLRLPDAAWRNTWKAELFPGVSSEFVLQRGEHSVVLGGGLYQPVNGEGIAGDAGNALPSDFEIDITNECMLIPNRTYGVSAVEMAGGSTAFVIQPHPPIGYGRSFLSRQGDRFFVASVELPRDPHLKYQPTKTVVELHNLEDTSRVDDLGRLIDPTQQSAALFESVDSQVALSATGIVVAIPNEIYMSDMGLNWFRMLKGEFKPVAMSLDELGRIHLIAQVGEARHLRIITPDGEQLVDARLPAPLDQADTPPIIGYDHRVYLVTPQHIAAFDTRGSMIWLRPALKKFGGATITAGDKLLGSDGGDVIYFGPTGQRVAVVHLDLDEEAEDEESLSTPPILTKSGRLLVASGTHLYCFEPTGK
jgi:hypothetical protein